MRVLIGAGGAIALLLPLLAFVWRLYGPGTFGTRLELFRTRWEPFYGPDAPGVWRGLLTGFAITLEAAIISIVLSLAFGLALAMLRLARHARLGLPAGPAVRWLVTIPVSALVQAVRSSPLLLLVLYTYLAAPKLGLNLGKLSAGIVALTLYTSCVLAEIMRAGLVSLDRGQVEAAHSLGLGYLQTMRLVVLPQALRRMLPSIVAQLSTLVKDTSLLSLIAVLELSRRLFLAQQYYFNPIESFMVSGAMYFVVNATLSAIVKRLERRSGRRAAIAARV